MPFLNELGLRIRGATEEAHSFVFLIQRLSVAVQTGNAISELGTLGFSDFSDDC